MQGSPSGFGLPTILFVVFLVLKLTGVIAWSWLWVTAPLWIPVALALFLLLVAATATAVAAGLHSRK